MKMPHRMFIFLIVAVCSCVSWALDATKTTVKVSLQDGSVLIGEPIREAVKVGVLFGDLILEVSDIFRIDRVGTNTVKVTLKNNDLLTGTPRFDEFSLKTSFGTVEPAIELVKEIVFTHGRKGMEPGLVLSCGMESREEIEAAGGSFQNATFVEGVSGKAISLPDGSNPVKFLIGEKIPDIGRGCVAFWARILQPEKVEQGGQELNLAVLRPQFEPAHVYFRFAFTHNEGSGHGGLVGKCFDNVTFGTHRFGVPFRIRDIIAGDPAAWHHYAISWDEHGIDGGDETMILFVDGKRVCSSRIKPHVIRGRGWATGPTALTLLDPWTTPQSAAIVDELKVWDYAKTDFGMPN